MKICCKCGIKKDRSFFTIEKRVSDGLVGQCRDCMSKRDRKGGNFVKNYGVTCSEYRAMCRKQDNKCLICDMEGLLHIDHDHKTSCVRGLLCHNCNLGLGHFKDSPRLLIKAAKYLNAAPKKPDWKRLLMRL